MKVHRRDPQLAPIVTDVTDDAANRPVSRAALKRMAQYKRHATIVNVDARKKARKGSTESFSDMNSSYSAGEQDHDNLRPEEKKQGQRGRRLLSHR